MAETAVYPGQEHNREPIEEIPSWETHPHPTPDFEYQGFEFKGIDPDKDIFTQLQEVAGEDNPGLVGVEWLDEDGLRYRVSSHEKLVRTRTETRKTFLPRLMLRNHIEGGPAFERKDVYEPTPEEVDHRTVDVINAEGDVVDVLTFTGRERHWIPRTSLVGTHTTFYGKQLTPKRYKEIDRFEDYFYVPARSNPNAASHGHKVPRNILGIRLAEPTAEQPIKPVGRIEVPVISDKKVLPHGAQTVEDLKDKSPEQKTQELFDALSRQREGMGKNGGQGWRGLTWNSPFVFERRETGYWRPEDVTQMQIVRDEIILKDDPLSGDDIYPERIFEVRSRAQDGSTAHTHIYTVDDLMKLFSNHEKLTRKRRAEGFGALPVVDLDLHWETPEPLSAGAVSSETVAQDKLKGEEIDRSGLAAEAWQRANETPVSLDTALALLCYPELYPPTTRGRAELQKHIDELKEKAKEKGKEADFLQLGEQLQKTLDRLGGGRFHELVRDMYAYSGYETDLHRLGIDLEPADESYTWVIQGLMEQQLQDQSGALFEDSERGRLMRSGVIGLQLGKRFKYAALGEIKKQMKKFEGEKEVERTVHIRVENAAVTKRLRALMYESRIQEILKHEKDNIAPKSALKHADLEQLGRLLRLSFGRSAPI